MKRTLGVFLLMLLFICPFSAGATVIGQAQLALDYSAPTGWASFPNGETGTFYLDYDAYVSYNGTSFWSEAFCVEYMDGPPEHSTQDYTLLAIDSNLGDHFSDGAAAADRFFAAAWIAENYFNIDDNWKAAAQIAVWEVMFDYGDYNLSNGEFQSTALNDDAYTILNALKKEGQLTGTNGWALAVNPVLDSDGNLQVGISGYQNYLVKNPAPVPEPATMLLLGTGLVGIAGMSRKKFKK